MDLNEPQNSRLFILHPKGVTENCLRSCFEQYGQIEDVWILKDKRTSEDKGVCYIKFSKASEAALALEEMNGQALENFGKKPLKVMIANSRSEGSTRDAKEEEKTLRLFVLIPKDSTNESLKEDFEKFGDVEYVNIIKDRSTGDNKGFAYVKFFRPVNAAKAYEECDRSYKPKFAEPQRTNRRNDGYEPRQGQGQGWSDHGDRGYKRGYDDYSSGGGGGGGGGLLSMPGFGNQQNFNSYMNSSPSSSSSMMNSKAPGPLDLLADYPHNSCLRLQVVTIVGVTRNQLASLFNLIPGMEYCDLNESSGLGYVRYLSASCASYAKDKLDGFEFPPGSCLTVQYSDSSSSNMGGQFGSDRQGGMRNMGFDSNSMLGGPKSGLDCVPYCSFPLPHLQAMSSKDTEAAKRLFIVCKPKAIPEQIMRDCFSRFGNLISVYIVPGKNFGYANYATEESAERAMQILHGQVIYGQHTKVLEAEPPRGGGGGGGEDGVKRPRY